jgi:hypothetical protein
MRKHFLLYLWGGVHYVRANNVIFHSHWHYDTMRTGSAYKIKEVGKTETRFQRKQTTVYLHTDWQRSSCAKSFKVASIFLCHTSQSTRSSPSKQRVQRCPYAYLRTTTWRRILCWTKHHVMKRHGRMEVELHTFLTWVLHGDEWSASRTGSFTPGKEPPVPIR